MDSKEQKHKQAAAAKPKRSARIESAAKTDELLIKSKHRVRQHGEVFTPRSIVHKMIDQPGLQEDIIQIDTRVLEPSVGEGVFLVEILKRRLEKIREAYGNDLTRYESAALVALSTLYGIELLEDNVQLCSMNLYQVFHDEYRNVAMQLGKKVRANVEKSAMKIISVNIALGDFLTRKAPDGKDIVLSEWRLNTEKSRRKMARVTRTEHSLEDVFQRVTQPAGYRHKARPVWQQTTLFDLAETAAEEPTAQPVYRYIETAICDVYREEMEEYHADGKSDR
ncbi:MAG: N-6 DNA methylase [Veillonellaceae bacterium]|nr:N-6 DNA methylase [Veillonellaceae bacterium]